jgi:hypothetical protein
MVEESTLPESQLPSTPSTSSSKSPHWSESFVEHLRTVHFALSILAVAMIFTLLSGKEYDEQKAIAQALEIRDMNQKWDTEMIRLFDNLTAAQGKYFPVRVRLATVGKSFAFPDFKLTIFDIGKEDLMSVTQWQAVVAAGRRPTSIASFRSWWNTLHRGLDIPIPDISGPAKPASLNAVKIIGAAGPPTDCHFVYNHLSPEPESCWFSPYSWPTLPNDIKLDGIDCSKSLHRDSFDCHFTIHRLVGKNDEPIEFLINGSASHIDEKIVRSLYGDWGYGDFDTAFPDLTKAVYPNLEYIDLNVLTDKLSDGSRGDQVIEAFGLKIAASDVSRWGVLLLLAAQFYFWLHLRELTVRIAPTDPGWNVAWIGIYQPWLALITVIISACAFPIVAASLAGSRIRFERHPHLQLLTECTAIGVSAYLAISTMFKLCKLRSGR